jgi:ATP-dependent RNA helicase RhlB
MDLPEEVLIEGETVTVCSINQQLFHVGSAEKMKLLIGLIRSKNPASVLIFTNTKQMSEEVASRLGMNGFDAEFLTGDLAQSVRQRRIDKFKSRELHILVATDVAARGLHIDDLELVVNYDIPQYCENYVHRVGRTARAGKPGTAVTLACERNIQFLSPIEKFIGMKIPATVADDELYADDLSAGKRYRQRRSSSPHRPDREHGSHSSAPRRRENRSHQESREERTHTKSPSKPSGRRYEKKSSAAPSSQNTKKPQSHSVVRPHVHTHTEQAPVKRKGGFLSKVISIFKK